MNLLADQGVKEKIPPWECINIYGTKAGTLAGAGLLGHHIVINITYADERVENYISATQMS